MDADNVEGVAAVLADTSGQIWIHGEASTLIPHALLLLLHLIRLISLFYMYTLFSLVFCFDFWKPNPNIFLRENPRFRIGLSEVQSQ